MVRQTLWLLGNLIVVVALATSAWGATTYLVEEDFATDPGWIHGPNPTFNGNNFGYSTTSYASGVGGEMGGEVHNIGRSIPGNPPTFYGTDLPVHLSLDDTFELNWSTNYGANYYGFHLVETYTRFGYFSREGTDITNWFPVHMGLQFGDDAVYLIYSMREDGYAQYKLLKNGVSDVAGSSVRFMYDPNAGAYGRMYGQYNNEPVVTMDLLQTDRAHPPLNGFDTFGMFAMPINPLGTEGNMHYFDNVAFTMTEEPPVIPGEFMQPSAIADHTGPYNGNEWAFQPENLITGAGILDYNGQTEVTPTSLHMVQGATPDGDSGNSWMSGPTANATGEYIVFDFQGEAPEVTGIYIWPWLDLATLNRSVKDIDIYVGDGSVVPQTTQAGWQSVLTKIDSITVAQAVTSGSDVGAQGFLLDTPATDVRYILFDIRSTYGGDSPTSLYPGLSEVGFAGTPPPTPSIPGDANGDGTVDAEDAKALAANWGTATEATWAMGDFDGDRAVGPRDASILAANWGYSRIPTEGVAVPEPGTLAAMLGLGLGVLLTAGHRIRRLDR